MQHEVSETQPPNKGDQELVEQWLLEMIELVACRVGEVSTSLLEGDVGLADRLIAGDDDVNRLSRRIEQGCTDALVQGDLAGEQLRFVVAAMYMNSDVERSGDLVVNIAKAVGRLQGVRAGEEVWGVVARMSALAQQLLRRASEALQNRDRVLAASIVELDDLLDDLHYRFTQDVIREARRGVLDPQHSLQLGLVGRFYERIGDHAENLGERVGYIIDGSLPDADVVERTRHVSENEAVLPGRGLAVIDSIAVERRIDAIRRDFVANVSHELKTPVAAISLLAETLAEADEAADRSRLAGLLRREAVRVADILDDLLELTRLEETEPPKELVAAEEIVTRSVDKVRALAAASRVGLNVEGLPSQASVVGDRRSLVRALTNLLDNAIRYSDADSEVTVAVDQIADGVAFSVRDQGIGIPRAELERVFERFYRVDRARSRETGGTGLGLAIVRHVADSHNGRVLVESKPGAGSTFTLEFRRLAGSSQ